MSFAEMLTYSQLVLFKPQEGWNFMLLITVSRVPKIDIWDEVGS